jgi:RNA polymerase sigma-54 factor
MAVTPKLELRQSQGLVMTPQLQQAIKLLQMSHMELMSFVEAELERNPLLEMAENGAESDVGAGASEDDPSQAKTDNTDTEEPDTRPAAQGQSDSGWLGLGPSAGGSFNSTPESDFSSRLARETTLYEHLTQQLHVNVNDAGDRLIGGLLIGMVDEAGYLTGDVATVAVTVGADLRNVERVLKILQDFDPPGVCARSLQECLELQLKERGRFDPAMAKFIARLDLVAKRDFATLQKLCGVSFDDIVDMVKEVKALNPKPGNAFGSLFVQAVIPDVVVKAAADGGWLVELNSETLPRLLVNRQYMARVSRNEQRETDKVYLSECLSNAQWLVKSLDQRARTILKVAKEIVRQQDSFLMEGVSKLKPLNLKTVAEAIAMHESTVSRVTSNKFMATPRGTFELKYFFTTGLSSTSGAEDLHSAEAVRHRIRQMIDAEAPQAVLSDDQIVTQLKTEGIDLARRTVAKYREALGIPSSVQRRREKQLRGGGA